MTRQPISLPELSKTVRRLCRQSPYSMKEVLDYAGIPVQNPHRWDKGEGRLYHHEVVRLANILNQPVDVFLYKGEVQEFVHVPRREYESQVHIPKDKLKEWIADMAKAAKQQNSNIQKLQELVG